VAFSGIVPRVICRGPRAREAAVFSSMLQARRKVPSSLVAGSAAGGANDDYRLRVHAPGDVFWVLRRHVGKSLAAFLVVAGLSILAFLYLPKSYASNAKVLMRLGRESLPADPTVAVGHRVDVIHTRESEMNSEASILRSRDLHLDLIDEIGPARFLDDPDPADPLLNDKALWKLEAELQVFAEIASNIITVSYTHSDPNEAQAILERLTQLYVEKHIRAYGMQGNVAFFESQAEDLGSRIASLRERLRAKKDALGLHSIESHQATLVEMRSLVLLEQQTTASALMASRAREERLKSALDKQEKMRFSRKSSGTPSDVDEELSLRLSAMLLRETELLTKYDDDHELVAALRKQIRLAQELLRVQQDASTITEETANPNRLRLELELILEQANGVSLAAQQGTRKKQLATVERDLAALRAQTGPILALRDELNTLESKRMQYLASMEQVRLDERASKAKFTNINVIQRATLPTKPAGPPRLWILVIGIALASFTAVGAVLLADYYDKSFLVPSDVSRLLDTTTLATFPKCAALRIDSEAELPVDIVREFELLAGSVLSRGQKAPTIAVTGARSGAGVSTIAFHLAVRLSSMGSARTLLVDGGNREGGLTDAFEFEADGTVRRTGIAKLDVLPRREGPSSVEEVAGAIEQASASPSFVVLDLPAVSESAFAVDVAGSADGTLFVVDSRKTDVASARRGLASLTGAGARVLGIVLNRRLGRA